MSEVVVVMILRVWGGSGPFSGGSLRFSRDKASSLATFSY